MAFYLQLRNLKKEVQRQLDDANDTEKSASPDTSLRGRNTSPRSEGESEKETDSKSSERDPNSDIKSADDPYARIPGIESKTHEDGSQYYLVSWSSPDDPKNPRTWSMLHRLKTTLLLFLIAFVATAASSIDSAVAERAAEDFGVASVTEALGGTAIFLIGFGLGALLCSPLSELLGRYPTYVGSLGIFGIWLMASALSPNIGAQIVFRFLAGLCASAPLTVCGGSMSDIWNPKEKTWAFPLFAISGFGGPAMGPVIGAYIGYTDVISWRWSDWLMLIFDGIVIFCVLAFMEETLTPRLLKYRAYYFRKLTGDSRFKSEVEVAGESTVQALQRNFSRPFLLAIEPIVLLFTLYLTVVYIVLFTFLDGYPYIFQMIYHTNSGLTFTIFVALFIGITLQLVAVPFVYKHTVSQLARDGDQGDGSKLQQETRLLYAMVGAPAVPIGLFWMGWTNRSYISIWSPIMASVMVGFGIVSIFLSAYMYIIDSYEAVSPSALTFATLVRYLAAGGMTVVGIPMYENLGSHYTLTILACISAAVVPIPYALYIWGPKVRSKSKYAVK